MASYRIVSADAHVYEPSDLWTTRAEPKYKDRAPRIVRTEDGSDWWVCDGLKVVHMGSGSQPGVRFEEPEKLTRRDIFQNVRSGGYIPEEHVKDLNADGVDVSVVYPTAVLNSYSVPDSDLLSSLLRTYNDWVTEFCNPFPTRLNGIAMLNVDDVQSAVKEMERCSKMGLIGAMITVDPPAAMPYDAPEYEPLWAAAQDLGMPLSLHLGTNREAASNRPEPGKEITTTLALKPAFTANADHWVRMSLGHMIFSGVFERYPDLRVGAVEHEVSWVPYFLEQMDYTYTQRAGRDHWHRFREPMLPSDYFHRNVFVGLQQDSLGIRLRDLIGVDNLQWGSDYPHQESTFPRSQQILEEILADCTEEEKAKIAGGNAARIYHLD